MVSVLRVVFSDFIWVSYTTVSIYRVKKTIGSLVRWKRSWWPSLKKTPKTASSLQMNISASPLQKTGFSACVLYLDICE